MASLLDGRLVFASGAEGMRFIALYQILARFTEPALPQPAIRDVYGWAFDKDTNTLLLVVWPGGQNWTISNYWQLVSLRYEKNTWVEVQRLRTNMGIVFDTVNIAVCDSRVLFGGVDNIRVNVYEVDRDHIVRSTGTVRLDNKYYIFACTRRRNDTLVAFSHDNSVSLQRFDSLALRFELRANVEFSNPKFVMFSEEMLLVTNYNSSTRTNSIVSLRVSGSALTEKHALLDDGDDVRVNAWALERHRLFLWDKNWNRMKVYIFV